MPSGAIYVGRPTRWGNPFIVGQDGTAANCVHLYRLLLSGYLCLTCKASLNEQRAAVKYAMAHIEELRGKDLVCWCAPRAPCHADVLIEAANRDHDDRAAAQAAWKTKKGPDRWLS